MTLGSNLKLLREKSGLTIDELAERTHIGSHILEDFEAGDYSRIRAAIYGSGFVKILAKHYGVDPAPLREAFAVEYETWLKEHTAAPLPKQPPQKFSDRRVGASARPAQAATPEPPKRTPPAPAPAQPRAVRPRAIAPAPEPIPQPPPAEARQEADAVAEEPIGGLFEADAFTPPAHQQPEPEPAAVSHAEPPAPRPPVRVPRAPSPEEEAAEREMALERRRARKERLDNIVAAASESLKSLSATVGGVIRTPLFQRIGLAALALALSAWICTLFIGGGGDAPQDPQTAAQPQVATAQPPASQPVPEPQDAEPAIEPDAGPATEQATAPAIVNSFSGSALTDNLLPPPDSYAD